MNCQLKWEQTCTRKQLWKNNFVPNESQNTAAFQISQLAPEHNSLETVPDAIRRVPRQWRPARSPLSATSLVRDSNKSLLANYVPASSSPHPRIEPSSGSSTRMYSRVPLHGIWFKYSICHKKTQSAAVRVVFCRANEFLIYIDYNAVLLDIHITVLTLSLLYVAGCSYCTLRSPLHSEQIWCVCFEHTLEGWRT